MPFIKQPLSTWQSLYQKCKMTVSLYRGTAVYKF